MISAHDLIETIAREQLVPVREIMGKSRAAHFVRARHMAMAAIRLARPDLSLPAIARIFGRDHTSVMHGIRRATGDERAVRKLAAMKTRGRA